MIVDTNSIASSEDQLIAKDRKKSKSSNWTHRKTPKKSKPTVEEHNKEETNLLTETKTSGDGDQAQSTNTQILAENAKTQETVVPKFTIPPQTVQVKLPTLPATRAQAKQVANNTQPTTDNRKLGVKK